MKLFSQTHSPDAREVRVLALETGLAARPEANARSTKITLQRGSQLYGAEWMASQ
jgi:hypothetical protein